MTKVAESNEIWKNLSLENMEGEIWKDIQDYEGFYQISNLGRVKSLSRTAIGTLNSIKIIQDRIMRQSLDTMGYLRASFNKDGKKRDGRVHRLVALHFIENPENKHDVNHIDGNKCNNYISNLEWNTRQENVQHAVAIGLREAAIGERCHFSKIRNCDVPIIRQMAASGAKYNEIAKHFPLTIDTISRIVRGINWKHIV